MLKLNLKSTITLLATALATSAAMAQGIGCTKIGFKPGTPDPNYCFQITPEPTAKPSSDTLSIANAHADAGDARTLQQAQTHADQGDARTLNAATQHNTALNTALQKEAFGGIAQAAALAPMDPQNDGETTINIGAAAYGGQAALGLAISHQFGGTTFNAGAGTAGGKHNLVRFGLGWRF